LFLKSLYSNIDDRSATLKVLADHAAERGITTAQVRAITGWTEQTFTQAADQLLSSGSVRQFGATLIAEDAFGRVSAGVLATLEELHEQDRLSTAVSVKKLRSTALRGVASEIENAVLRSLLDSDRISIDRDEVKLTGRGPQLSDNEKNAIKILLDTISAAGLEVPKIDEAMVSAATKSGLDIATTRKLLQQLLDSGQLVRINIEFAFSSEVIRSLIAKLQSYAASVADRAIDVPTFKNVAGVSRKYAIPLLEYFDHTRVTVRRGDKRIIL
jgi:selenocysteine-specific elongation factor